MSIQNIIGGFMPTSVNEYPGKISAVIFTIGCNFRCPFCQNPTLVLPSNNPKYPTVEVKLETMITRGLINAVSITGGEPTIHGDTLLEFLYWLKSLKPAPAIQLETNGTNPEFLRTAISSKLVDYIAMDIKAPLEKYPDVTGLGENFEMYKAKILESIDIIIHQAPDYQFRTTFIPQLSVSDFHEIGKLIQGAKIHYIQEYRPIIVLRPDIMRGLKPHKRSEYYEAQKIMAKYVKKAEVRL